MMRQIIIRRRRRRRPLCNLLLLVVILLCSFVPSFGRIVDPYKTLGVSRNSSQKDIQKRYRELCLKYHPDKNVQKPTKEREKFEGYFKQVQQAYDMIGSAESRQQQNFQQRYGGSTTSSQGQRSSPFGSDPLSEAAFRAFATGDRSFFTRGMGSGGGGGGPSFGIRTPFPSRGAQSPMMPTNLNFKSIYIQKVEIDLETLYKGVTSFRFELRDNLWSRYRAAIRGKVILLSIYQGMMYSFPVLRASKLLAAVIGLCVVHVTLPRPDPQASYAATLKKGTKGGNTNVKFASTTQGQPEVIFQVESAPHPIYRRENDDLHLELEISSLEAKDGCKKIIKALDPTEKSIEIKIPPNLYSYEKQRKKQKQEKSSSSSSSSSSKSQYDNNIRIKNRGWPIRNNIQSSDIHPDLLYGDLIVEIKVLKKSSKKRGQRR